MTGSAARRRDERGRDTLDLVVRGLAVQIESLCRTLLPGGQRRGWEWHVAARHSPLGGSIDVHVGPARPGVWCCWAGDERGDALELVAKIACDGDRKRAFAWARDWLGLAGETGPRSAYVALRERRGALVVQPAPDGRRSEDARGDNSGVAFRMWLEARPGLRGTLAETYLRARGIDLAALGKVPGALRFAPALRWPETGEMVPALLAGVIGTRGERHSMAAVHRTFLAPDGSRRLGKMTLGPIAGGLIPLRRGASGRRLREAPDGDTILLTEGIEDGLSAALARPDLRIAAALNLGNLSKIALPPAITNVIIAADNDAWWQDGLDSAGRPAGRPHAAARGLDQAVRHFQAQGRIVRLARAQDGKDFNDLLRGTAP